MKNRIELGILFSRTGSYELISNACRDGVLTAINDINSNPFSPIHFEAVERDPQSNIDQYAPMCEEILRNSSARHIIGCITSWSRKEVIPALEKLGGTLWYPTPYEGFEANDRVVYTHACPNQQLVPMLSWVAPKFGANGFLLGSNYIWGWEMNRVARDLISDAGGEAVGERYLPIGDTDVTRIIDEIQATRPNFILNNMIGETSYAFYKAYAELAAKDPYFTPDRCPILSCNLTECELGALDGTGDGHLTVGPYFDDALPFAKDSKFAPVRYGSSLKASGYSSVMILAQTLEKSGFDQNMDVSSAFQGEAFDTPFGRIQIDPQTHHTTLPVVIGQIDGLNIKSLDSKQQVTPDPYLSRYSRSETFGPARLRVVS
ncbi:MAG: transporter substrate-binding protein [Hyphomicrobiales bacterium]